MVDTNRNVTRLVLSGGGVGSVCDHVSMTMVLSSLARVSKASKWILYFAYTELMRDGTCLLFNEDVKWVVDTLISCDRVGDFRTERVPIEDVQFEWFGYEKMGKSGMWRPKTTGLGAGPVYTTIV